VVGEHGGLLKIQLAAPPVDGAANDALLEFLANRLGITRRSIQLVWGHTGRRKRLRIEGLDAPAVLAALSG
jgi:uncharacterized protein